MVLWKSEVALSHLQVGQAEGGRRQVPSRAKAQEDLSRLSIYVRVWGDVRWKVKV